jgi:hypothetical protein
MDFGTGMYGGLGGKVASQGNLLGKKGAEMLGTAGGIFTSENIKD